MDYGESSLIKSGLDSFDGVMQNKDV